MKVLSIYFSATGGTKTFQQVVQKTCENYDISFTELDVTDNTKGISQKWLSQFDVFLIGSPIIYKSIPTTLSQIIKKNFIVGEDKKVIFYTTSAKSQPSTIYGLAHLLKSRGYAVSGVVDVKSFNNFYFSEHFKPNKINSKSEVVQDYQLKARIVKELLFTTTNDYYIYRYVRISHAFYSTYSKIINTTFGANFSYRHLQAKHHFCTSECTICADNCPNSNIVLHNNYPTFGKNCLACSRCIQHCPHNAIAYNGRTIKPMNHLTIYDF